ncbi:hypothetical protein PG994_004854 [Apiospora phragmitis]|uniref:Uncharacterized protein n=1 Tax=Apiospora phragmitis TaxID=2905665 RepID=A0ABR1VUT5_9PEZI
MEVGPCLIAQVKAFIGVRTDQINQTALSADAAISYRLVMIKYDFNSHKRLWFQYAMESVSMMHSTLAMAAALWRAENTALEKSIQLEGMRQKYQAIREIRTQLPKYCGVDIQDSGIAYLMSAMSTLVFAEIYDGNFDAAEMHLQGVHTLFNSHSRRSNLEADFVFCKATGLADILVATTLGRQLVLPTLHVNQTSSPVLILDDAETQPLDSSITESNSDEVVGIFSRLRQALLARQSLMLSSEDQQSLLNDADFCILQYLPQARDTLPDATKRTRALVLAAHVFMYATLRQVPPKSTLMRRMVTRLQYAVGESLAAQNIWAGQKRALVWIAFVGMLGTGVGEACPQERWFLNLITCAACAHSRADYVLCNRDIRQICSAFLWDEAYCQPVLAELEKRQRYCGVRRTDP